MRSPDALTDRFREQGLRVTPQRQCIFRLLDGNNTHPTVESLYEQVRAEMPTISLKTVYQMVHDLAEMGEVRLIDLGTGTQRVDPNVEKHHYHLVCTRCGKIEDVQGALSVPEIPDVYRQGFSIEVVEVNFRGLCETCASPTPTD